MSIMAMGAMLAPIGCSFGGDGEASPASGAPAAIAVTVDRLERAIAKQDFATVCNDLFTEGARRRAGGRECATQLRSAAEGVRRPKIELRAIRVTGERATVDVVTEAKGQARVKDELRLRRESGRWRVEALS
jgi:hypothetical protein